MEGDRITDLPFDEADEEPRHEDERDIGLRRVRHPLRAVTFTVAVCVLIVGAFVTGTFVRSPEDDALRAAVDHVDVTAEVEDRVVADAYALPAQVVPGDSAEIHVREASVEAATEAPAAGSRDAGESSSTESGVPGAPQGAERVVVTAVTVAPGDTLTPGRLLAEVSGRPVFALPRDIPLYRDIAPGDVGKDVEALQQVLLDLGHGGGRPGTFDEGTQAALGRLYRDAGYSLPYIADGVRGVALREFAALPSGAGTVLAVAEVGTTLGDDNALLRVQTSVPRLSARVTVLQRDRFVVGERIGVSVGGGAPVPATILVIDAFGTDEKSGVSGHPLTVELPAGVPADDTTTKMLVPLESPPPGPAVPTVALSQEGGRTFVVLAPTDASTTAAGESPPPPERVEVVVRAQADGWSSIEPDDRLVAGTRVRVA